MKTIASLFILFFVAFTAFGEAQFQRGYLIGKDGKKVECFIKNTGWTANPSEINYKLDLSGKTQKGDLSSIREFGIYDNCKYINAHVKIDRSTKPTPGAKNELAPVWKEEDLFLKVVLEGKANLYEYADRKVIRFFYSIDNKAITPLIYKEIYNGLSVIKNTDYRQQLWDKIRVQKATFDMIKGIEYTSNDLTDYFKTYNEDFKNGTM